MPLKNYCDLYDFQCLMKDSENDSLFSPELINFSTAWRCSALGHRCELVEVLVYVARLARSVFLILRAGYWSATKFNLTARQS